MLVRSIRSEDLPFLRAELTRHWGDVGVWSIGRRYQCDQLPGFVAVDESQGNERVGQVTYLVQDGGYQGEIVTLSSLRQKSGVGTALLDAAVKAIREAGCVRAYLTTTNDNVNALRFYQKRGWRLAMLHKGFVDEARKHAPVIPMFGMHGIRLRDEIELEMFLNSG